MPLFNIQYTVEKVDIFTLSILFYNEAHIRHTIDILYKLTYQLKLDSHISIGKKMIFKDNWLTIHNIIKTIFYDQKKLTHLYSFNCIKSIFGLFYF